MLVEEIADHDEVVKLVDRILAAAGRPLALRGQTVSATLSIGITFHRAGVTSDQLLSEADRAMYAAKERGGNRYTLFDGVTSTGAMATR